jgi:hypothetical protein
MRSSVPWSTNAWWKASPTVGGSAGSRLATIESREQDLTM